MKARDVMRSPVITVKQGTSLGEVAGLFQEKRISGAPVVDEAGRLVGIITEYDLLQRSQQLRVVGLMDTTGWISPQTPVEHIAKFVQGLCTIHDTKVEDVMTRKVTTVDVETPLEDVARLMVAKKINRLPVLDNGELVGIISRRDLIWAVVNLCEIKPGLLSR